MSHVVLKLAAQTVELQEQHTGNAMDRVEAYALLSEKLEQIGSKDSLKELPESFSLSEDVNGAIEGMLYTIDMRVGRDKDGTRMLFGSIHDNNPARFSLLEERKSLAY